jgi:hypothetical protein
MGYDPHAITATLEFKTLCAQIVAEQKTPEQWAEIESDDMFRTPSFAGGFEAIEMAFCFSYYDSDRREFWFQLTLEEIQDIAAGRKKEIDVRDPD